MGEAQPRPMLPGARWQLFSTPHCTHFVDVTKFQEAKTNEQRYYTLADTFEPDWANRPAVAYGGKSRHWSVAG